MKKGFVSCLLFMCLGMAGCQQKDVEIRIIPQPQSVETTSGTYRLQKQATFTSNLPETEGKEFAEYVQARANVSVTYYPYINVYQGRETLQLVIRNYC